jgi:hypothetical protein
MRNLPTLDLRIPSSQYSVLGFYREKDGCYGFPMHLAAKLPSAPASVVLTGTFTFSARFVEVSLRLHLSKSR